MDKQLINTVNKLQDALGSLGAGSNIDLPQITVVGSQSSGKSSVLENIVGRDFLPRGSGIVTRRPLILQLITTRKTLPAASSENSLVDLNNKTEQNDIKGEEWGEFLHLPGKKFYDFNEIRNEITRETETKVGTNAGISSIPINLRIHSPNVLTLTLVDLPGLTKVPVGDQPKDIERQIKKMLLTYISKPNAIILSVTASNTDLANSDGLKLAREVDPEGSRTIGVLTKIDLMDKGTDVIDILAGRVIPLKYGYVPVINRSQQDISTNKSIKYALKAEKDFFENHPSYRANAQYCGTPFLARKLNMILRHHIKSTLPDIKNKVNISLAQYRKELSQLGEPISGSESAIILNSISEFSRRFNSILEGKGRDISTVELQGGARIAFVMQEIYHNAIYSIDPFDQLNDSEIRVIYYNSSGSSPSLFIGTQAFEKIVKQQLQRFEAPSLKCVSLVYDELILVVNQALQSSKIKRYPALQDRLSSNVLEIVRQGIPQTKEFVKDIIKSQVNYVNSLHPDLITGHRALALADERLNGIPASTPTGAVAKGSPRTPRHSTSNSRSSTPDLDGKNSTGGSGFFGGFFSKNKKRSSLMEAPPQNLKASAVMTDKETMDIEVIKILVNSYFEIMKREIADSIPKAIVLKLVKYAKDNMQMQLLEKMYKASGEAEELLKESSSVVERRENCKRMVESLTKASEIVATVR